ncbi:hypothetical protein BG000_000756 [Podila horticola]|nr:hypothetical protein BG000_000756 [Podila horticola]
MLPINPARSSSRAQLGKDRAMISSAGIRSHLGMAPVQQQPLGRLHPTEPHMLQRTNSLVGYGLTDNPEESLKSALPKLISSYSTSEIPTRLGKGLYRPLMI